MSAKIPDQKEDYRCRTCRYEFRSYREEPDCPRCGQYAREVPGEREKYLASPETVHAIDALDSNQEVPS